MAPMKKSIIDHTYRDYSQTELSDLIDDSDRKNKDDLFPAKLHRILATPEYANIIAWKPHGRAWAVINKPVFVNQILPRHFQHSNYESFNRSVNGWGMKRLYQDGPDQKAYYHEMFLRGKPELCAAMSRLENPGKRLPNKAGEPNFYEISRRFPVPDPPPVYTSYSAYGPPNTGGPLSPMGYQPHSSPQQGYNPYSNHHAPPPPYGYPGYPPQHQPGSDGSNAYGQYPQPPQQGAYGHYQGYPPPYGMYPPQAPAPAAQEAPPPQSPAAPPQTQTNGAAAAAAEQTGGVEMNVAPVPATSSSHNQPPSDPNTVSNSNNSDSDDDHFDFDEDDLVEFDEKLYQRVVQIEKGLPVLHTNQNKGAGENAGADQAATMQQPPYEAQAPAAFNNFGY